MCVLSPFSEEEVSMFELQSRPVKGGDWKTVKSGVVDFGIQGDFLYASVYKTVDPDVVSGRRTHLHSLKIH
jgi:hypothetical protein